MKSIIALVSVSLLLSGFTSCEKKPDPPSAVEVPKVIPVPCRVAEPQCSAPAYDAAKAEQPGDEKVKLLRAETAAQSDCLRRYRAALTVCRAALPLDPDAKP